MSESDLQLFDILGWESAQDLVKQRVIKVETKVEPPWVSETEEVFSAHTDREVTVKTEPLDPTETRKPKPTKEKMCKYMLAVYENKNIEDTPDDYGLSSSPEEDVVGWTTVYRPIKTLQEHNYAVNPFYIKFQSSEKAVDVNKIGDNPSKDLHHEVATEAQAEKGKKDEPSEFLVNGSRKKGQPRKTSKKKNGRQTKTMQCIYCLKVYKSQYFYKKHITQLHRLCSHFK